ncbi:hypothetical protein [Alteriqipengyuania sp. 357]
MRSLCQGMVGVLLGRAQFGALILPLLSNIQRGLRVQLGPEGTIPGVSAIAAALWAMALSGCGSGIETGSKSDTSNPAAAENRPGQALRTISGDQSRPDKEGRDMEASDESPLSRLELQSVLPFSRFAPADERSLSPSLLFRGDEKIVYATSGEAVVYDIRYFEINDSNICVFGDKNRQETVECVEFFKNRNDLFRLRFTQEGGSISGEMYARHRHN